MNTDQPIKRTGFEFVAEIPANAVIFRCERGIVVADPEQPAYLISWDGIKTSVPADWKRP